jgi:hypothetical protein
MDNSSQKGTKSSKRAPKQGVRTLYLKVFNKKSLHHGDLDPLRLGSIGEEPFSYTQGYYVKLLKYPYL